MQAAWWLVGKIQVGCDVSWLGPFWETVLVAWVREEVTGREMERQACWEARQEVVEHSEEGDIVESLPADP